VVEAGSLETSRGLPIGLIDLLHDLLELDLDGENDITGVLGILREDGEVLVHAAGPPKRIDSLERNR